MARKSTPQVRMDRRVLAGVSAAAILAPMLVVGSAQAVSFNRGELSGSFDTTLTMGALFRVQSRDPDLIGVANGGRAHSINGDNGNLNYDKGLVSLAGRATHELKLSYGNLGAFVRGTYFYDVVNAKKSSTNGARTNRFAFNSDTVERVGRDFDLLDAFVYGDFAVGDSSNLSVRLGKQVLSWGESTFIQNGINSINPIDVSALRVPGSELKEGFLPVPIADINFSLNENISLEAFYQFKWDNTEPEAAGSFFSTNDAASPGGERLFIGFGNYLFTDSPNQGAVAGGNVFPVDRYPNPLLNNFRGVQSLTPFGTVVPRSKDDTPSDSGQYGLALRIFAEELNNTEFGFYYTNLHSRVPVLSSIVGSLSAFQASSSTFTQNSSYRAEYPEDIQLFGASFNTTIPFGISLQGEISFRKDQPLQLDDVELLQATLAAPSILGSIAQGQAAGAAAGRTQGSATFNSAVAAAVAGNPALRPFTGLTFEQIQAINPTVAGAISAGIAAAPGSPGGTRAAFEAAGAAAGATTGANQAAVGAAALFNTNQIVKKIGVIQGTTAAAVTADLASRYFGKRIQGWEEFDVTQAQMTATKAFERAFGADQWVVVTEVGGTWISDMPDKSVLRLEGPGTVVGGNAAFVGRGGMADLATDGFADAFSWGYRAAIRFDYLNALPGVNLYPSISWQHDVNGTTPTPLGNFIEGRKAVSLGLRALVRETITVDLAYSNFFGAGKFNLINDRDFVSASVKYSF
ncbi:DUF1302 domain-containing protein [Niveispirillum cyanobacteriorum]|uniref:Uncharacterized protein n=1 Tax=Niveispirillum cyanobacteriorum TaxID=1612173 RepID=A0A2K9NDS6_9PROT|nr:DUF1302 domain-containing protein [Niveispirillum cyanobacteriorum]AUN30335.1 hypothetical protein C0V82_08890 [Niveispirillum cyanobacteriorum]GGE55623.1 hypothetical protein GCM10011317_12150 [Niveispirillum cyanobacteriorum]